MGNSINYHWKVSQSNYLEDARPVLRFNMRRGRGLFIQTDESIRCAKNRFNVWFRHTRWSIFGENIVRIWLKLPGELGLQKRIRK